jgi:GT2 family glycosyltransferase
MNERTPAPAISVVVASHDRPVRLRWLLNALECQTLPRDQWEVLVGHDSEGPETERLLRTHPLAREGVLRHVQRPPGSAPPGANRNVQGRTTKDPVEDVIGHAPHYHFQRIVPPTPWAECCNIVYPREIVDAVGGFDEHQFTGEDTDLKLRCEQAGAGYVGAREVLTYHSVHEVSFLGQIRGSRRWKDLPYLLKKHPDFRANFPLWIFWKRSHVWLPFYLAGLWLAHRRHAVYGVLCVPYALHAMGSRVGPRGRVRDLIELPTHAVFDLAEMLTLLRGSVKYRTLLL